MAKILSYSSQVISNRLKRDEASCKGHLDGNEYFETIPAATRSSLPTDEVKASQISGKDVLENVQAFFARPGSTDKILGSLKPWGYAGIQSLAKMIIIDVCSREPTISIPTGPASQRLYSGDTRPTSGVSHNSSQTLTAVVYRNDGTVRDVRPWLVPNTKNFPLVACKYFGFVRCHKGDDCSFLHQAEPDYVPPVGYGADRIEDAARRSEQVKTDNNAQRSVQPENGRSEPQRTPQKRPYDDTHNYDRRVEDRAREERRRPDYDRDDRRQERSRDLDRGHSRQDDSLHSRVSPPRRTATADRYQPSGNGRAIIADDRRIPARRDYDDRPTRRDGDTRHDERDVRRPDRDEPLRTGGYVNGGYARDAHSSYDSYRPSIDAKASREREVRRVSRDHSRDPEIRRPARDEDRISPTAAKSSGTALPTDPFKNAETLLEKSIAAQESNKPQMLSMLDRYLTLQSKSPKTENNIQIYEYLLNTIEQAAPTRQARYLNFLHSYLALVNRNATDYDPMGAMMNLAEQSTGEVQARAVPLLDRYMILSSSVDLSTNNGN